MSLYNMLFGVNPFSGLLLGFLDLTPDKVPRFRDCYVTPDGQYVAIHTRTGGGNRDFYESEERCRANYPEYFTANDANHYSDNTPPSGPWNDDLRAIPGFSHDKDDDFDCTYATFYFKPDADAAPIIAQIAELGGSADPAERWKTLLSDMDAKRDTPMVAHALRVGKPLIEAINAALNEPTEDTPAT